MWKRFNSLPANAQAVILIIFVGSSLLFLSCCTCAISPYVYRAFDAFDRDFTRWMVDRIEGRRW